MKWAKLREANPVVIGIGAGIAAIALISSVLALVIDTVQILGIEVTSEGFVEAEHNLEVALTSSATSCAGVSYSANDVVSVNGFNAGSGSVDLGPVIEGGGLDVLDVTQVCIRNATGNEVDGELVVTLLAKSSLEVGVCSTPEFDAETALRTFSCDDGDVGELDGVVHIEVFESPSLPCNQSPGPVPALASFGPAAGTPTVIELGASNGATFTFPDGAECIVNVRLRWSDEFGATRLLTAVSDTLAFDIALSLRDVTP